MPWILKFLLISIFFLRIKSLDFNIKKLKSEKDESVFDGFILELITMIMKAVNYLKDLDISENCRNILDRSFFIIDKTVYDKEEKLLAYYYYNKVLLDSSTNVNDLSSYHNCLIEDHQYDFSHTKIKPVNPLYATIFIDHRKEQLDYFRNNSKTTSLLLGICFIDGCTNNDIKLLSENVLGLLKLRENNETLEVFTLNEQNYNPDFFELFIKLIPINLILIHIFIAIFHNLLSSFFQYLKKLCCKKKIRIKIEPKLDEKSEINKSNQNNFTGKNSAVNKNQNLMNYIKTLFDIEKNFDFLINSESKDEIHHNNNDSSLSYMNGIKGISMFTIIFGFMFLDLYNAPITKKSLQNFYEIMSNPLFFLFYFGIKYAPKLLLCSSGFSLFYKFMCFLDDKSEAEKEFKKAKEEEQLNLINENDKRSKSENINKGANIDEEKKEQDSKDINSEKVSSSKKLKKERYNNISYKYYLLFIAKQINKYFLYILVICFILFSLYDFSIFFVGLGPLWTFFKMKTINTSLNVKSLVPAIFSFQSSFFFKFNIDSLFTYYYLIYQEIMFFVFSTFIIFIGYKYNLRIDRFILLMIFLLFVFRLFYYYLSKDLNVVDYFDLNNYGSFYNSPIYNYLYYILGIYFGSLNYVIQKRYTYYECEKQKKLYLLGFTRLLKIIRRKSKLVFYVLGIIFLFLIIFFTFWQFFLFLYVKSSLDLLEMYYENYSKILNYYNNDILVHIIMMFDTDIVVLLVNLMALFFYLKGENIINDFLNLNFFAIFNKIYFSFLLVINPIILYVFYMTESRINFSLENCYLYSLACGFLILIFSILLYSLFELPYKKVIRLLLQNCEIGVKDNRLDFIEKQFLIHKLDENKDDSDVHQDESLDNSDMNLFDLDNPIKNK